MQLPIYQIDAFASEVFRGNPAAVCPLGRWLDDEQMQAIAEENSLSETAFFIKQGDIYHLRWFTPVAEVDLCGHATLASAFVILNILEPGATRVRFMTRSGELIVTRRDSLLTMDFPAQHPQPCQAPQALIEGLGETPRELLTGEDYFAVFESENVIRNLQPDMRCLKKLDRRGVIVTAPGETVDFVSRFFAPKLGVNEDPVTGSAHCALTPYWSAKLKKQTLTARQLSHRGGDLHCKLAGDRVFISGRAVKYMEGTIEI